MDQRWRSARAAVLAVVALGLGLLIQASPARAEVDGVELGLLPVGQPGAYFDVVMSPGETRELEIEIANHGSAAITARTYAADVYTIINGGFGGRLHDEAATGTTLWLDYAPDRMDLAVGHRSTRSFLVTVPDDAGPGEYISSVILETEDSVERDGTMAANQVIRQAVGVVVTVPGQRSPAMEVGEATHTVLAGRSVLSVAVSNPGNVRLKPLVGLTLHDADGQVITQASIRMDTFYAVTDASVEVPLDALLRPGSYTIEVEVSDVDQGISSTTTRSFSVEAAPTAAPAAGTVPGLSEVDQDVPGSFPWPGLGLLVALAAIAVIAALWIKRSRPQPARRRARMDTRR